MAAKTANGSGLLPAAVHRVAPETLARIFTIALTSEVINDPDEYRWDAGFGKSPTIPLAVSSVCRKWRQVALDTNSLWSVIYYGYHESSRRWESIPRVRLWLHRSEGTNLALRLQCGRLYAKELRGIPILITTSYSASEQESVDFVDEILLDELHRCERLRLQVKDLATVPRVLHTLKSNPSSSIVSVNLATPNSSSQSPHPKNTFDGLWPSLREIDLRYFHVEPSAALLQGLRRICLEDMTAIRVCTDDFLAILQGCPNLIELQLKQMYSEEGTGFEDEVEDWVDEDYPDAEEDDEGSRRPEIQHIHLPKLTTLALRMLPMAWVRKLTSRLVVPALRNLTASQFYMNDPNATDDMCPTLIKGLTKLDMSHVEVFEWDIEEQPDETSETDIAWFLCHLPELRSLDIGGCSECKNDFIDILFQDVELPGRPHRLCPTLVELKGISPSPSVIKLLEARRSSARVSSITRFHLSVRGKDEAEEHAQVKDLVDEVVLTTYG